MIVFMVVAARGFLKCFEFVEGGLGFHGGLVGFVWFGNDARFV